MEKDDSTCLEPRRLGTDFWFHRRIHHMALMKPAPPGQPNLPLLLKPYLLTDELKGLRESATRFHYGVYARNAGLSLVKTLSHHRCAICIHFHFIKSRTYIHQYNEMATCPSGFSNNYHYIQSKVFVLDTCCHNVGAHTSIEFLCMLQRCSFPSREPVLKEIPVKTWLVNVGE